tara:strand:+ start:260 stop:718 length:459 start_codon:yes stop_codon:yes gene_type:complete
MTTLQSIKKIKTNKMRVGRGIGSGKGKTSGRGVKGQKSRSGVAIKSFEGGQMPLFRRLPKRGFKSFKDNKIAKINLDQIQLMITNKKIDPTKKINLDLLQKHKIVSKNSKKLKILGSGELKDKLDFEIDYISENAKIKIEKIGCGIIVKQEN